MSKSYSIDRSLTFNEVTGYWTLSVTVTSSSEVSPRPFLMEKAILGTGSSTTLSSDIGTDDEQQPQYLRTLLESESATQRLLSDDATYDKYTWVQYRSNSFTKEFYTYDQATRALSSALAVLKSNARVYATPRSEPRLVCTNLSSKEKEPSLESLALTKGDTVSLQLVNGPTDTSIITDGTYINISRQSTSIRRKSNSYVVKVTSDTMTYLGLIDNSTQTQYKVDVSMNTTSLEGEASETIE